MVFRKTKARDVDFGCDYCADDQNRLFGHVTQIASNEALGLILLSCPRCGSLYENTAGGADQTRRLSVAEALVCFPGALDVETSLIDRVCRLPIEFRVRNISMKALLLEMRYRDEEDQVAVAALRAKFERHPELIEAWVLESGNTRSSSYPWLRPPSNPGEEWIVGQTALAPPESWQRFESAAEACAVYVKKYVALASG